MKNTRQKIKSQTECDRWNQANPIGTEVQLKRDNGQLQDTKTRSEAYVSNSGDAVIFLENVSGYYLLNRVTRKPVQTTVAAGKCPTCNSPRKSAHPATQFEGEVNLCRDPWHEPTAAQIEARHVAGHPL